MPFTTTSLAKARAYADRLQGRMTKLREHAETAIEQGAEVAEVTGISFALGYANGRWGGSSGEVKVMGVPADLALGCTLTGIGMFGGLGSYAQHGVNLGSGALAAYGYRSGFQMGVQAAQSATNGAVRPGAYTPSYFAPVEPPIVTSGEEEVGYDDAYRTYTVSEPVGG